MGWFVRIPQRVAPEDARILMFIGMLIGVVVTIIVNLIIGGHCV